MDNRAVRGDSTNKSGRRQTIMSRFSSWLSSCLSHLRLRMALLELDKYERERRLLIKKHCDKGFHKLSKGSVAMGYKNKFIKVEYLECVLCKKYKFFSTIEDKRKYLMITSEHKSAMEKWVKEFRRKKYSRRKKE